MTPGLHLIGAGGHAKVIVELAHAAGRNIAGIYDDQYEWHPGVLGYTVTGPIASLPDTSDTHAIIAVGNNRFRQVIDCRFQRVTWSTLIHPFSWVSPSARLGPGTVVLAGVVVQAQATLGRHVIANTGCSIDHDCAVEDYVHLAPGSRLAGGVHLGEGSFLGTKASAIPGVTVGEWSIVGAGAVVSRSLPANITAVGAPAKVIKERPTGWQND